MLRDPRILILDEATSNLDAHNERLICERLHELLRGRTSVVIVHHPSSVVLADIIFVMQDGRIVESGTHRVLASRWGGGIYGRPYVHGLVTIKDD